MVETYEFVVRIRATEPPPDYGEVLLKILRKEVATRMGPSATVDHFLFPRSFTVRSVVVDDDGVAHASLEEVPRLHPFTEAWQGTGEPVFANTQCAICHVEKQYHPMDPPLATARFEGPDPIQENGDNDSQR